MDFTDILKYEPLMRKAIRKLVKPQDVEDCLQDAMLLAWNKLDQYRGESLASWLYKIASNVAYDKLRELKRKSEVTLMVVDDGPMSNVFRLTPKFEREYVENQVMEKVRQYISCMSNERHRRLLTLHIIDGLQWIEIGEKYGEHDRTVGKMALHRHIPKIKEAVKDYVQ